MPERTHIRGILIDPVARTVTRVDVPHESRETDWRETRDQLGCEWIDRAPYDTKHSLWIDDEGFLVQPNPNGYFKVFLPHYGRVGVFAGKGLILGTTKGGFDTDESLDLDNVSANVRFIGFEDLGPEQLNPTMTITVEGKDGRESTVLPCAVRKAGDST